MAFTYTMIGANGREISFDYPKKLTREEAQQVADDLAAQDEMAEAQAAAEARQKSEDYGILSTDFALQDLPLSVMQAVGAAPRVIGQAATALGADEFGSELLRGSEEYQKKIESMKSEGYQARRAQNALEMAQAEGQLDKFLTSAGQTLSPVMLSQELIKMTPELAMTGAAGRLASGLGAGVKGTTAAAIGTGASLQAGDVLGDVYQITYDNEIEKGTAPEEAASMALSAARANAAEMFGVSVATMMLPGATALERTLAGVGGGAGKGLVSGAVKGFLGEATQEATEETYGQLLKNIQERQYDPEFDVTQGLAQTAGQAGVLGGILGAPAGGIQGVQNAQLEAAKKQVEAAQKAQTEADAAAVPVDDAGQMTLPGIEPAQEIPGLPTADEPVVRPAAPAGEQLEMFDAEGNVVRDFGGNEWFPNLEPQDRIDAIDAELEGFDTNPDYADLSPQDVAAAKASLKRARKNAVAARQKLKIQAKEDAEKAKDSAFVDAQEDLFGIVPTQEEPMDTDVQGPPVPVSEAFGGPQMEMTGLFETYNDDQFAADVGVQLSDLGEYSRAGNTFNQTRKQLVGLDLNTPQGRSKARAVLDRVGNLRKPSKWQSNLTQNLGQKLDQIEQAESEAAKTRIALQPFQGPEAQAPAKELRTDPEAQNYVDNYNTAKFIMKDEQAAKDIDEAAKQRFGAKAWGGLKRDLTADRTNQIKALRKEVSGRIPEGGQFDMFAQQDKQIQRSTRKAEKTLKQVAKTEVTQPKTPEQFRADEEARAQERATIEAAIEQDRVNAEQKAEIKAYDDKFNKALKRSNKGKGAAKVMDGDYVYRGYQIQKTEDGVWNVGEVKDGNPATEFDDAADTLTDAKAIVDNYIKPEVKDAKRPAVPETEVGGRVRGDDQLPAGERGVEVAEPTGRPVQPPAEAPVSPEPRRVADTTRATGRDTGGAKRKPTALEEAKPKSAMEEAFDEATEAQIQKEIDDLKAELAAREERAARGEPIISREETIEKAIRRSKTINQAAAYYKPKIEARLRTELNKAMRPTPTEVVEEPSIVDQPTSTAPEALVVAERGPRLKNKPQDNVYQIASEIAGTTDPVALEELNNELYAEAVAYVKKQRNKGTVEMDMIENVIEAAKASKELPKFKRVNKAQAPAAPNLPKSLQMLRDGIETYDQFETVVDAAIKEGYFSKEERTKIISTFSEGALGETVAKHRVITAAKSSSYFNANVEEINAISLAISKELANDTDGMFHRSDINKGTPLSQKADLERDFSSLIEKLRKYNNINIVQSANEVPYVVPAGTDGVYLNGEVYIIADNVSPLTFEEVIAHETIGHLGLEGIMTKPQFNDLLRTVNNLKRNNPTMKGIVENLKRVYTNEAGVYTLDAKQEAREILAFMAQRRADYLTAGPVRSLYNRVASAVRKFLMGLGFTNKGERIIDQLVYEAAMYTLDGKHAVQKDRSFMRTGSQAQDLMQRAWDLGFTGYNLNKAAKYLDDVHSGKINPQVRTLEDIDAELDQDPYDGPMFSRKPIDPATVDPRYRDFIPEPKDPARSFKDFNVATGWTRLKDIRNKLRVGMFDQAATFEDKIMNEYNNAVQKADGTINPMVSYVQALKHSALAHQFMRTGVLRLKDNGLWDTLNGDGSRGVALTDVYEKIAEMGKRIGSIETARKLAGDVYVARREIELHNKNIADEKAGREPSYTFLIEDSTAPNGSRPMTQAEEDAHIAEAQALVDEHYNGEIEEAFEMYNQWRDALLQVGVDTGYISADKKQEWLDSMSYVPFYRVSDEMGSNKDLAVGSGLMNLERMKQLRGSVKQINDPLDNMEKLGYWFIASAIKNHGAKELTRGIREYSGVHSEYDFSEQIPNSLKEYAVSYIEDGKTKYLVPNDPLDAHAWKGMEQTTFELLAPFSKGAEWLRKGITLSPDFIISQLEQDTVRAYTFSGIKSPSKAAAKVLPSFIKIRKNLAEGGLGGSALNRFGIMGMYDISPEKTKEFVEQSISTEKFDWKERPLGAAFRWGERNAEASDLAPRMAVFEETLNQGGSEVEAFWRAAEIINFSRRGNSSTAVVLRQVVPFMNAYMQGMRVLAKAMTGRGLSQQQRTAAFKQFWWTGMKIAALSTAYAMAMADDDEYAKQPAHVRSRFFVEPESGLKFALPADVAFLFKHIPETIVMSSMRDDMDGRKVRSELRAAAGNAFLGPNVTPQLLKPLIENATNYSFFRDAPIVSMGMQNRILSEQFTENTSQLARLFSVGDYGVSPLMMDNLLRGMFGTTGAYVLQATDLMAEQLFDIERTERELADLPIVKSLVTREYPTGYKTDFYNLRNDVTKLVGTVNLMKREGRIDDLTELMSSEDNRRLLGLQKAVNRVNKTINESNRKIKKIQASDTLSSARKKELIDKERERQASLSKQIARMRMAREG